MQRHITDRPDRQESRQGDARLARFLTLDHRGSDRRIIARMRARKGQAGSSRLTQYLRIARGLRA